MARALPTPQQLVEPLRRLLAPPAPAREKDGPTTGERILDAALAAFTAHGVRATTMTTVAKQAGISREWLYKFFANKDALVLAVTKREAVAFIDGLATRAGQDDDFTEAVTEVFVFAVEFLRDHQLLQRVLRSETDVLTAGTLGGVRPLLRQAIALAAGYLGALGGLEPEAAAMLAETMVRLIGSTIAVPEGVLDLHDPEVLRRYAATTVPAVVSAARSAAVPG